MIAHGNNLGTTGALSEDGKMHLFVRPAGGLAGAISRTLPPLPAFMPVWYPTTKVLRRLPSYRLLAFGLVVVAITALLFLVRSIPWMRISPAVLILDVTDSVFGGWLGSIVGWVVIIALALVIYPNKGTTIEAYRRHGVKFWDRAALHEEQWFRTGAEYWTAGQRVYSVLAFGMMHVTNMIYPIASLLVVTLVGMVFMLCYLRVYGRTGDRQTATLATAKLHAAYNRWSVVYMVVALAIVAVDQFGHLFF